MEDKDFEYPEGLWIEVGKLPFEFPPDEYYKRLAKLIEEKKELPPEVHLKQEICKT